MIITFLPLAQKELDNAFSWYEDHVVGLGYEFLDALDQTLRIVASFPEIHVSVAKKYPPLFAQSVSICSVLRDKRNKDCRYRHCSCTTKT